MNVKKQPKQILFDVPTWMYNRINYFVINNGMTKKGLMHKLLNDFLQSHQKEFEYTDSGIKKGLKVTGKKF